MGVVTEDKKPGLLAYINYILVALFLCYEMALQASPSVMTHALMHDLKIDAAGLGLMAACYFYAYTIMQIPAGLLFDYFSMRNLVVVTLSICVLGALCFQMPVAGVAFAALGRFFMGVGSAFAFIAVLVVATHWFPARYFALLVGIAQLLAAIGAISGELPLAAMLNEYGWRPTILGLAIIGAVLALAIWIVVRDYPANAKRIERSKIGLGSVKKVLIDIVKSKQTWWVALYAFSNWAPVTVFAELWGVPYLMRRFLITNTEAATMTAMLWIGIAVAAPVLGWWSDRIGRRNLPLEISALVGLVAALIVLYMPTIPVWFLYVTMFFLGAASAGQIVSFAIVRENNKESAVATAIGFNNMAVVAGGALFQPLVGFLLRLNWDGKVINGTPMYTLQNYQNAFWIVPLCFVVGWVASRFFIRETNCQSRF